MTNTQKSIGYFGVGIFTYLWISDVSAFLEELLHDLLILGDIRPIFTLLTTELTYAICFIILVYLVVKRISQQYNTITKEIVKYLICSLIIFIIIQLIAIAYPSFKDLLVSDEFYGNEIKYLKFMKASPSLYYIQAVFYYIAVLASFYLIYKQLKNGSQQRV